MERLTIWRAIAAAYVVTVIFVALNVVLPGLLWNAKSLSPFETIRTFQGWAFFFATVALVACVATCMLKLFRAALAILGIACIFVAMWFLNDWLFAALSASV